MATGTVFGDPHGISTPNIGTARDVALLGRTVFRDERLQPGWRSAHRSVSVDGPNARTVVLDSIVEMLNDDHIIGGKTGTHKKRRINNLAVAWQAQNGQVVIAVVMGSANNASRYADMRTILARAPIDFPELAVPPASAAGEPSA